MTVFSGNGLTGTIVQGSQGYHSRFFAKLLVADTGVFFMVIQVERD